MEEVKASGATPLHFDIQRPAGPGGAAETVGVDVKPNTSPGGEGRIGVQLEAREGEEEKGEENVSVNSYSCAYSHPYSHSYHHPTLLLYDPSSAIFFFLLLLLPPATVKKIQPRFTIETSPTSVGSRLFMRIKQRKKTKGGKYESKTKNEK